MEVACESFVDVLLLVSKDFPFPSLEVCRKSLLHFLMQALKFFNAVLSFHRMALNIKTSSFSSVFFADCSMFHLF
jgi:hypothetical protein